MHYYQFNIGDYAKSTLHLSLIEDLAYRRLLDRYYDTEKPLETDLTKLCRFIRLGSYEKETQQVLDEFFSLTQKGWIQKRVQKELGSYSAKAESARANGKKGGRPKKTQPVILANPPLTQEKAKQEPLTIKQEPLTNVSNRANKFAIPTTEEIGVYFLEKGSNDAMNQADKFHDFYTCKNWMVGKNKMKDWKAAVRNWIRGDNEKNQRLTQPTAKQAVNDALTGANANNW